MAFNNDATKSVGLDPLPSIVTALTHPPSPGATSLLYLALRLDNAICVLIDYIADTIPQLKFLTFRNPVRRGAE